MTTREPIPSDLAWRMWLRDHFGREPDPDAEVKIRNIGGDDAAD